MYINLDKAGTASETKYNHLRSYFESMHLSLGTEVSLKEPKDRFLYRKVVDVTGREFSFPGEKHQVGKRTLLYQEEGCLQTGVMKFDTEFTAFCEDMKTLQSRIKSGICKKVYENSVKELLAGVKKLTDTISELRAKMHASQERVTKMFEEL